MSSPAAPWKRIYDDVKMHIPGLVDAVFKQMFYHVMNDFLDMTNVWLEEIPMVVSSTSRTYPLTVSHKGDVNRLMLIYDTASHPGKHWVAGGATMNQPGVVVLNIDPPQSANWMAVVAKTLGDPDATTGYPDMEPADHWIINKYGDGIEYGILGRLMGMPAKPYSNPKIAKDYWQTYVTERGKARTDQLKSNIYGGQRWMFPQSFATVRRGGWI
jgi:hypothetical protein